MLSIYTGYWKKTQKRARIMCTCAGIYFGDILAYGRGVNFDKIMGLHR